MVKQPTGFFTNRGDMIYEGDIIKIISYEVTWPNKLFGEDPINKKIINILVGRVAWNHHKDIYIIERYDNRLFSTELRGLLHSELRDDYFDSQNFRISYHRLFEVLGDINDLSIEEKVATAEKERADIINKRKTTKSPPDTVKNLVDNRGFWSKLWEKLS